MDRNFQLIKVYLGIAQTIATLSRCENAKVGAIIVKDKNIISYGYNGTPSGFCNQCEDENSITYDHVIHAETNAILKAGINSKGADLFLTLSPCVNCCKLIKQAGIRHVFFLQEYRDTSGLSKLKIPYTHVKI